MRMLVSAAFKQVGLFCKQTNTVCVMIIHTVVVAAAVVLLPLLFVIPTQSVLLYFRLWHQLSLCLSSYKCLHSSLLY